MGNLVTARTPQEFKNIANPHHDLNLYQILYTSLTTPVLAPNDFASMPMWCSMRT